MDKQQAVSRMSIVTTTLPALARCTARGCALAGPSTFYVKSCTVDAAIIFFLYSGTAREALSPFSLFSAFTQYATLYSPYVRVKSFNTE